MNKLKKLKEKDKRLLFLFILLLGLAIIFVTKLNFNVDAWLVFVVVQGLILLFLYPTGYRYTKFSKKELVSFSKKFLVFSLVYLLLGILVSYLLFSLPSNLVSQGETFIEQFKYPGFILILFFWPATLLSYFLGL